MGEFRMPMLGADMEAGTLVEWLKHPGDEVHRGDIMAVVDTQKGAIEIEVFEDGVLDSIAVPVGQKVPVGTVLAVIRGAGAPVRPSAPAAEPVKPGEPGGRRRASPAARQAAAALGVDLDHVTGTGPGGAITLADVAERPAVEQKSTAMRSAIAAAMARSKREIPHYYLATTIDLGAAMAWLRAANETRPMDERLLPVALLIKAVALGLRDVPELNGFWASGAFQAAPAIHIGCAIALRGGGLVAPALHDTDKKDPATLSRELRDLVARARAGSLRSSELADSTITVTNLGEQGVDAAFGIIYPPQVALVGFGRILDRPTVIDGRVEVRPTVTATLAGDHRASDGHRGGRLLAAVDRLLQAPGGL
jgi:pyruvate dehydrogenase E2 component (dihydrolipoamide acetyltransferase)